MTENALLGLCEVQGRLIARLLHDVEEGEASAPARTLADVLPLLIELCEQGGKVWTLLLMDLISGRIKIKKEEAIGRIARRYIPETITMLERVRGCCRRSQADGKAVDRFADFEKALGRYRESSVDFLTQWRWIEPGPHEEEAYAAYKRGESQEAREFFNELLRQAPGPDQGPGRVVGAVGAADERDPRTPV
jgi:hypothetical protein